MGSYAKPVALQMWSVRDEAVQDFFGTLEKLAQLGCKGVEHVHMLGYGGHTAAEVVAFMTDHGLKTAGVHTNIEQWDESEALLGFLQELGTKYVSIAWLAPERRTDEAAYRETAEILKGIASQCEEHGLKLLHHHHDFEFEQFNGQYALDLLGEWVGPDHLGVEVDVHWAKRSGVDPVAYLHKVGARCPLVHFKDLNPDFQSTEDRDNARAFTPIGTGCMDFQAIAEAAQYAEWYIIEQDFCNGDPLDCAKTSIDNLTKMGLAG